MLLNKNLIKDYLEKIITQELKSILNNNNVESILRPTKDYSFGDLQINGLLAYAKQNKQNPIEVAKSVIDKLKINLSKYFSKVEIAGPGFINLTINNDYLIESILNISTDLQKSCQTTNKQTIVVDYSSPNIAKEMHVGHIRSTVIGDASVRILEFIGHKVIRANHLGDWGTQFGMLIARLEELEKNDSELDISDLDKFYRQAKERFDQDPIFADHSRNLVVKLQSNDEYAKKQWQKLIKITLKQNNHTYKRLNISLTDKDVMGESMYNDMLPIVTQDLLDKKVAVIDEGAVVVYLDEFKNKEGKPMGVIIQKKDGGFIYTTTDIACIKYRHEILKADRIIYYVDSRQAQHLKQVFSIARKAGYAPNNMSLEHHYFGMILGENGQPFKSRSGDVVKLADLLDEAIELATKIMNDRNIDVPKDELNEIIHNVAIGAVKYADLSKNRATDYIFSSEKMLSLNGNTSLYIQYAYTRILSIFNKSKLDIDSFKSDIIINNDETRKIVIKLIEFPEVINKAAENGEPHLICTHLYELTSLFGSFYENNNILNEEDLKLKASKLSLIANTAKIIKQGLSLLGINTLNRM